MNKKVVKINGDQERLVKRMKRFKWAQKMFIEFISVYTKNGIVAIKKTGGYYKVGKPYKAINGQEPSNSVYESVVENKVKQHKANGKMYLELHTIRNNYPESIYTINGEVVDKEQYESILPPSKRNAKKVNYFIVKAENVISVR